MSKNTFSAYETPTQLAEKRKQHREKDKALTTLQLRCHNYNVFLRSDAFEIDEDEAIIKQCDYIEAISMAAMEVYHPGTAEFLKSLESE